MISAVSDFAPSVPSYSQLSKMPTYQKIAAVAMAAIFFATLIQPVESGSSAYIECTRGCIGDSSSFWKTLGCSAACTPFLIMP